MSIVDNMEDYPYEDVPSGRDLFLVKESDLSFLLKTWEKYISTESDKEHPNDHLEHRWAAIEDINPNFMIVNVCVDMTKRYHSVLIILPRDRFVKCVKWWNYEKRAYLVVADDWFESLSAARYSTFALVDAAGVKKVLNEKGTLDKAEVERFRKQLNRLSRRYNRYLIVSFADSVFIKTSWKGSVPYFIEYRPEEMIELIQEIRGLFKERLGLDSYAVMSQGTTIDYGPRLFEKAFFGNHFSIGSLGSPVTHLFEIDAAARANIKKKVHPAVSLYVTTKCFKTLLLDSKYKKSLSEIPFTSLVSQHADNFYVPAQVEDVVSNFKAETLRDSLWRLRFNYLWSWRTRIKRKIRGARLSLSRAMK